MNRIIFSLLLLFMAPFVFWNLSFGFYIGYILLLLFAGIHLFIKTKKLKFIFYSIAVGFAVYVVSFPFITEVQLAKAQREYIARIRAGNELNTIEKFNIYGLNAVAVAVAFPIL